MPDARLTVHLTPRGGRNSIDGWTDDNVLRVRVSAAPSDGAANDAMARLLASALDVAHSRVRLISGASSRTKTVAIEGLDAADARRALDAAIGAD